MRKSKVIVVSCVLLFGISLHQRADKPIPAPNFPVMSTVYNYKDATLTDQLLLRSDANPSASYSAADSGVSSQVYNSDWDLDLRQQTNRTVWLSFSEPVMGSAVAPLPSAYYNARVISRCFDAGNNIKRFSAVLPGTTNNQCSLRVLVTDANTHYVFVMSPTYPGTGWANVSCTAGDVSGACVNWTIVPNTDSASPNPTVANLYRVGRNGSENFVGSYHNRYRIDVVRQPSVPM